MKHKCYSEQKIVSIFGSKGQGPRPRREFECRTSRTVSLEGTNLRKYFDPIIASVRTESIGAPTFGRHYHPTFCAR